MPLFPVYDFSNPALDYLAVQATVKQMVSYTQSQSSLYYKSTTTSSVLRDINFTLTAMRYDAASDLNNNERWKKDVEIAYRRLNNLIQ